MVVVVVVVVVVLVHVVLVVVVVVVLKLGVRRMEPLCLAEARWLRLLMYRRGRR